MVRSLSRITRLGLVQGVLVFLALAVFQWRIALTGFSQSIRVYDSPEAAQADRDFGVQGEYEGNAIGLQVIASGENEFLYPFCSPSSARFARSDSFPKTRGTEFRLRPL